ncbi:hypothetical protein BASA81_007501 [Batrachochytrium salamandrivorans]|nr:hypothetical protein BASA81_007501 [Batrachochytrium salamandrivorans]
MRPKAKEEEEEEDLSAEVGMSYKEVLVPKPAVVAVAKPAVFKAQVLAAKPIAAPVVPTTAIAPTTTSITKTAKPQAESVKQTLATAGKAAAWKLALKQALGEEEGELQSCLLALVANTTFSPIRLAKDYAALQQLLAEYEQEAEEWELVKNSLVQLPPRLTISEELDVEHEEEDLLLLQEMQALSTLPATCLAALESTELRCQKIQQQIESCEVDSKQLAKAFAHTAFEEDARQPKKILKLLLGEDEFNF